MRGNFAIVRIISHWNRLLRAAMESLQLCKNRLDKHLPGVPQAVTPVPGSGKVNLGTA